MEKKMLFVYNPVSGKANIRSHLADIVDIFTGGGYSVTLHPTSRARDGYDYILARGKEFHVITVCGGDGMLNEAVNALLSFEENERPFLSYLPAGSTNDFAGTIGIPLDLKLASKMVVEGSPFFCDAGKFNDKYFAYVAAFGAFTSVSYDTAQEFKNIFGHMAYILEGIRQLPSIRPKRVKVSFDSTVIEDDFLLGMVTNSFQVGGIKNTAGTAISLNDGLFEVLLIKKPKTAAEFQNIISSFLMQSVNSNESVIRIKASRIKFESDEEIPWTLDGEFGGSEKSVLIENIKRGISVII